MTAPSQWPLEVVKEGDRVVCPLKPAWGDGVVIEATALGTFQLKTKKELLTVVHQRNSHGQRASVRFSDGRTRTVVTPATPLRVLNITAVNRRRKQK